MKATACDTLAPPAAAEGAHETRLFVLDSDSEATPLAQARYVARRARDGATDHDTPGP